MTVAYQTGMAKAMERFFGVWTMRREISNGARFAGEAVITETPSGALYREAGFLTLAGQTPIRAHRQFRWQEKGGVIDVHFDDGRFFHRFDPSKSGATARHLCAPDLYEVVYRFGEGPDWETDWVVRGPRKSYEMSTRYQRAPGAQRS